MNFIEQLIKAWSSFSVAQKVSIGVIFLVVAGSLLSLPFLLKSASYDVLYANLSEQDAGQIVSQLKNDNIPFRISGGGKTVLVPQEKVYETRLQLAMQNLPGGSVGFELFDKPNLGISDFVQELNYQRAIQGELSRTIMQIQGVEQARVHIVMPKQSVFVEDQKEPTASVVLKMRAGAGMNKKQISGIVHLVASSVEGLKPRNITIIDNDGNALAVGAENDSLAALTSSQYEMTQNVEKYLESKAQSMMDKVLGPQKSVVRVSAELDFTQIRTDKEAYDPDGVLRSEQNTNVSSSGGAGDEETSGSGSYNKTETVNNYEIGKTVQQIVSQVGGIKRLTVAVVVDGKYQVSEANADEKTYIPRTEDDLAKYSELVQQAVSFSVERNDEIKIQNIPFDTSYKDELKKELDEAEKKAKTARRNEIMMMALDKGGKLILIGLVIFFALKKLTNMRPTLPNVEPAGAHPAGGSTAVTAARPAAPAATGAARPAAAAPASPPPSSNSGETPEEQQAAKIAETLNKWIAS